MALPFSFCIVSLRKYALFVFNFDCAEPALGGTDAAAKALFLLNHKRLPDLSRWGACFTGSAAERTALALFGNNGHFLYPLIVFGRAYRIIRTELGALGALHTLRFINRIARGVVRRRADGVKQTGKSTGAAADTSCIINLKSHF